MDFKILKRVMILDFGLDLYNTTRTLEKKQIDEILSLSEITQQYNINLTPEKAKYIVCSSPFVSKYNIEKVVEKLLEVFYYTKNETKDSISDDRLIDLMKIAFDGDCKGSVTLLFDWIITKIIHEYNFSGLKEDEETSHIEKIGENNEE